MTALKRAEASDTKPWTEDERRAALIYLAHNRRQQIKRIRDYMNRGRFPLNEGQSPDAVPVFVDRHDTRCAVAHLMHSDGKDTEVAQIVNANNLVRVGSVHDGDIVQWIRTSGLTQEEVAMVQPAYPISSLSTFQSFLNQSPELQSNGLTLSDVSVRATRFAATLPTSFATDPSAIDDIFVQGLVELSINDLLGTGYRSSRGVKIGASGTPVDDSDDMYHTPFVHPPGNLDTWVYFGPGDALYSGFIGGATASGNVGIIEIDYKIRSDVGSNFSRIALSSHHHENTVYNQEQDALLFLSEIYRGDSNVLLEELQLFKAGDPQSAHGTAVFENATTSLSKDFLRIKTYGLVAGDGYIHSIFNEFDTVSSSVLRGDLNLDGAVTFADIPLFIPVLQAGLFQAEGDCDEDGDVDFFDIPYFIGILQTQ